MLRRVVAFMIALTLLAVSCSGNNAVNSNVSPTPIRATPPSREAVSKIVFILYDTSSSTQDPTIRERYLKSTELVTQHLNGGDVIVADAITDNPLGRSSFPVNETLPKFQPKAKNELLQRKEREDYEKRLPEMRSSIFQKLSSIISSSNSKVLLTKVFDSMLLAERAFKNFDRPRKVLVIFSDMIEESEKYNFQKQYPDRQRTKQILADLKRLNQFPNLSGVKVYVVGAAASTYQNKSSSSYLAVEEFWLDFFREAEADLAKERYGSALLNFDE